MSRDDGISDGEIRARLEQFGFSEKAVDAYLSIVDHGRVKLSVVAEEADVATSYVYELCSQLEADGLVTVEDHQTPAVVTAKPPSEAFERLIGDLEAVREAVAARYEQPEERHGEFTVVKSRQTFLSRLEEMIDDAEEEIAIQTSPDSLQDLGPALQRAVDRGVLVLLSLETERETVSDLALDEVADVVRVGVAGMPTFISVDQREGAVAPPSILEWDHTDDAGIAFVQGKVAPVLVGSFLGNYWPMSEEALVRHGRSLPRTYTHFRPAVFDATTHLRAGHDVAARMRIRPVRTAEQFRERSGTVIDVRQSLIEPRDSSFGLENTLFVEFEDGIRSVGGENGFLEDYETTRVTLMRDDSR
ncbi:TrmB family transcriptional regulator [Halapricum desulfuricans]|uniref:Sugar-specific transcriptional regulator TrmB n=1 Tax=Halapricum desulfuricans TaxID=2841257 RepID=A0A897N2T1_9EURY|nr:TrmB family transcriptional regulator [Halapricum desulfuricans]QSG07292.1 Sugar-specific transcriptional regulator TrmB [Halapricum desulfuricans]